jgi:hypothetical protein
VYLSLAEDGNSLQISLCAGVYLQNQGLKSQYDGHLNNLMCLQLILYASSVVCVKCVKQFYFLQNRRERAT